MGAIFLFASVVATVIAARRSLGWGVSMLMGVGYAYGIVRANFPDGITHFMFDASLIALYGVEFARVREDDDIRLEARAWLTALVCVALLSMPIGLAVGGQPFLVQLVGLRSTTLFLPMMMIGTRMSKIDMIVFARGLMVLNTGALILGLLEYQFGVERFYPSNSVTEIIYASNDVAGAFLRIPSSFIASHAFGGTLAMTTAPVFWRAIEAETAVERRFAFAALGASAMGPFLCGARQPVIILVLLLALMVFGRGMSLRTLLPLLVLSLVIGYFVLEDERLQRVMTLQRIDYVEKRIGWSVNMSLVDILLEYPVGAGLASAAGTSIPFFLRDMAQPAIGAENEYVRLLLELGVHGLALWLLFLRWAVFLRRPRGEHASVLDYGTWGVVLVTWGTAFIGTGVLTAIPATAVVMLFTGWSVHQAERVEAEVRSPAEAIGT